MNISKEAVEAHRQLSVSGVRFLEYLEKNPAGLDRSNYADLSLLNIDEGPVQPWPTFIDGRMRDEIKEAAVKVFDLIKGIPERLFGGDIEKMGRYYGIPGDVLKGKLTGVSDGHLANIVARGDFIFSPSAGMKCLEYNVSAGIGGWQLAFLEPYFLNTPLTAKFLREYRVKTCKNNLFSILLENFLNPALEKFYPGENEINIAVVSTMFEDTGAFDVARFIKVKEYIAGIYKNMLSARHNGANLKGEILFCDFHNLNIVGDCVFYKAKKIHVLVEMYHGSVPPRIAKVFSKGNVLLYNGPVTRVLTDKLNLALLSENEDSGVFSPEEREIIKKYIPRTRKIVPGLEDFILANREKLVLKPSDGLGGEGVYVGRHTPADEWEGLVELALLKKNWLVQEYIQSFPYIYLSGDRGYAEHDAVWGVFVFGSQYGGGFLRIIDRAKNKGVVNVHLGAEVTPLVEVEE